MVEHGDRFTVNTPKTVDVLCIEGDAVVSSMLRATTILVKPTGSLTLLPGAEIVFADMALDTKFDPEQWGNGLIVLGTFRAASPEKTPYLRLAREPRAGDTSLLLESAPVGWKAGDVLALPDTRGKPQSSSQYETVTIQSVGGSPQPILGFRVVLSSPLRFDHRGGYKPDGSLVALPHVANLSRSIVVRSENPTGVRGHVAFVHRADVNSSGVLWKDLGRTTAQRLNSTIFNHDGTVQQIGTNQIGRYSVHFHHNWGPLNPSNTGYQYQFANNVVHAGLRWGIALHDTHYGLIENNVVADLQGAGIVTEDGSESYNEILGNFVVHATNPPGGNDGVIKGTSDIGFDGSGIWLRQARNTASNNIVADCRFSGMNINGYYGPGALPVPNFRGADMTDMTHVVHHDKRHPLIKGAKVLNVVNSVPAIGYYADNEVYGCSNGLWGAHPLKPRTLFDPIVFDRWIAWNISNYGIFPYHARNMMFRGWKIFADLDSTRALSAKNGNNINIGARFEGGYESGSMVVEDCEIRGFNVGIASAPGTQPQKPTTMRRCVLENFVNISIPRPGGISLHLIEDIEFHPIVIGNPPFFIQRYTTQPVNIAMKFNFKEIAAPHEAVFIEDGKRYRLYFLEQSPDFVLPNVRHVPRAWIGLSNQQVWDQFGTATAGGLAPCLNRRADIIGFMCPEP